jgi:DNA-binding NarL/FixJ family response regulator
VSVRVLIVDDSEPVREGLRMVLDPAPGFAVVGEAADGAAGVVEARRLHPDVVLMDVRMPGLDGIEATRQIVALEGAPVRVLMLTTFDLDEYLFEALHAGVSAFALKDTPPDDLIAGILAVARDDALVDPETTVRLIARGTRNRPSGRLDLTAPELDLLELVAAGLSNAEIARRLEASDAAIGERVTQLLARLHVRDRIHAVLAAHQRLEVLVGRAGLVDERGEGGDPGEIERDR